MTRRSDSDNDGETSSPSPSWRPKKCKGEKHVSFPPDEEIVSGFAERKDTSNVDSLTLAEVIEAYKRSCDKHQVEPKPKILDQLESVCLVRLDVCNVALLQYPAQVLSRALLRSRLTVLHLQSTCLSGRPLFTLVAALKSNRALRELYLSNNNLNSEQDSMQLGDLLRYNSSITTLDLSNNTIADSGLEEICEGLRVQTDGLKVLILWNNQITHNGLVHLAKVLPVLKTLETLNLGENNLQNRGIHTLRESLMMNHSLLQLELKHTHITCEGAVALAEFLAESRQIQRLDVRENEVRAGGLMALSLALRINHSLTSLDLDHTPKQEQEDFLMETQKSLLREISELCMGNAARHRIATETELPRPDSSEAH
ncbi:protein phosphatase 1 regulatory subunit 37 [Coregonus clupeaformis]|uniref:protein phosphatase 1 regulatory subunit 37 n=1 Tax=Coregonus clupeaformis TaxID=59861 RepID=UPI001BDFDD9D|nr:protein phosphatase 1 regulatory subunit 37 [Coregonus clupeaformis]